MSELKRVSFTTISSGTVSSSLNIGGSGSGSGSGSGIGSGGVGPGVGVGVGGMSIGIGNANGNGNSVSVGGGGGGGGLSLPSVGSAASSTTRFGSEMLAVDQKTETDRKSDNNKTTRLKLELFETDSSNYPEFNYSRLMHLEKKKFKKLKQKTNGFSDPFNDNDDDVARIAKELEKKYGTTYSSGRGRSKKDDQCDIGMGYDESDSFIDNTEAYDEVVPDEVEASEGGFYINCGLLEFQKHIQSSTTKTDEIIKMPNRPKKRILSSSSEDSSSSDNSNEHRSDSDDEESAADAGTTKSNSSSTQPLEKRPKTCVAAATKKSGEVVEKKKEKEKEKSINVLGSSSNSPKPSSVGSDSDKERVRQKTVKTTTVKDMLKAKRDNFLKMQEGAVSGGDTTTKKSINGELKGVASKSSEEESSSSDESDDSVDRSDTDGLVRDKKSKKHELRSVDTKLPELDAEVITSILAFRELVRSKNLTGKKFLFDDTLTEVFLKIDESLMCVEKIHRNMVFAHLEFHLLLPKYFFLRKAKQLRIKEEKLKTKRALGKLRKTIIEAMPNAINKYEVKLREHAEAQSSNLNADHPSKMPKKKFPWNSNLRNLLYEVYQVRWTSYLVLGTRKETLEDFINIYLREKVVDLWPNGWMRFEELQREIEKHKSAMKKAKEKEKINDVPANSAAGIIPIGTAVATATATTTATLTSTAMAMATATATSTVPSTNAHSMATTVPGSNTYVKQFEDFSIMLSSRSCANSDTDSVASSNTSNGVKRKGSSSKQGAASSKSKSQKTIMSDAPQQAMGDANKKQQQQQQQLQLASVMNSMVSPPKKTDHSIHHIISNSTTLPSFTMSQSNVKTTATQQQQQQQPQSQKHSKSSDQENVQTPAVCVIDLDNYKSSMDILHTSQQFIKSHSMPIASSDLQSILSKNLSSTMGYTAAARRDSSSESDGVEIVGVFPSKSCMPPIVSNTNMPSKTKSKKNSNSSDIQVNNRHPSSAMQGGENVSVPKYVNANAVVPPTSSTSVIGGSSNNNNNNSSNKNNNNSSKKQTAYGVTTSEGGGGKAKSGSSDQQSLNGLSLNADFDVKQVAKVLKDLEDLQQLQQQAAGRLTPSATVSIQEEPHGSKKNQ